MTSQAILSDTVGEADIGPAMGFITMMIALGLVIGMTASTFRYAANTDG